MAEERDATLVLIADDDMDIREILGDWLEEQGMLFVEARNGDDALEAILVHRPDVVFLDVMMPGLSGWQICQYVRSKPELRDTGIVVISGIGERVNDAASPLFGADEHLDKPFALEDVAAALARVLGKRRP